MEILNISNITKTYNEGRKYALKDFSLSISRGQVFGLVGPNGAGKSTLIKSLVGLVRPDSGQISFATEKLKNYIGYMPEELNLFDYLTGNDYIYLIGRLRDVNKNEIKSILKEYKELLELPDMNELISNYSKGNKEKIAFLSVLVHSPEILILDEPFTGLDPIVIRNVKKFIVDYAESGKTVILSTHILEMITQICSRICMIDQGDNKGVIEVKELHVDKQDYQELINIYAETIGAVQ